jgi:HEAT repeat protein
MGDEKHPPARTYDALNSRSLAAKREYVRGLEQRRDTEAMSLLVECLCDESWYLRQLAEQAFLNLGSEGAPQLLPLLEQGLWFTRTSAAGILGKLGYAPAVPGLLPLTEDENRTVAEAASEALLAIGRSSGAVRIAHVLHRLSPDARRRRLDDLTARDADLSARIGRLMTNDELMAVDDADLLTDDHPVVRASEDGFEWEVLTSPPVPKMPAEPQPPTPGPQGTSSPQSQARPPGRREDDGLPTS